MATLSLLLSLAALIGCCSAGKIAIFVMALSDSQVLYNIRLAEELAVDHEVVLIRPQFNPKSTHLVSTHPKVRELRPKGCDEDLFHEFFELEHKFVWGDPPLMEGVRLTQLFQGMLRNACENTINDDEFMKKVKEEKFDFAIHHHIDCCNVPVIKHAEIPQWGWTVSSPVFRSILNRVGIPVLPSIFPGLLTDMHNEMSFPRRVKNFLWESIVDVFVPFVTSPLTRLMRSKYGEEFPDVRQLIDTASLVIANSHQDIDFPVPVTNKVVYLGGLGLSNTTKSLSEPFSSFVAKATKVVIVSFGTVADSNTMPQLWREAFVRLFKENPDVHFIWKMDADVIVPKNVLKSKWLPQRDLLGQSKVVGFITHAGYNSLAEAIASATPIIAIPLFGDQFRNSRLAEYRKFGIRIAKDDFKFDTLNDALHAILEEKRYLSAARELQSIIFSGPLTPGQILRNAVNFTLTHPDHNRDLPQLNLISLYSLDVIALFFFATLLFFYLFYRILRCYYWSCCEMAYKEKVKLQ